MDRETAFIKIKEACELLGWDISFDNSDEEAEILYLIIGTSTEVNRITTKLEE